MRNRVRVMCKPGSVGDLGGQPPRSTRPEDPRTPRTPAKDLSDRFTAASAQLNLLNDPSYLGARPPASELAALWVECNDARNYVLLGDPAARLRVDLLA